MFGGFGGFNGFSGCPGFGGNCGGSFGGNFGCPAFGQGQGMQRPSGPAMGAFGGSHMQGHNGMQTSSYGNQGGYDQTGGQAGYSYGGQGQGGQGGQGGYGSYQGSYGQ